MEIDEQLLRLGRRGRELRPFCEQAQVRPRGYSRPLQRVLTDFGAESSFGRAAQRIKEHYAIELPVSAVREHTLRHGRKIAGLAHTLPPTPAKALITQIDGSMVPVMQPGKGADRRRGKTLLWREVRLCSARVVGSCQSLYGATLGGVQSAAWVWQETARRAGCRPGTFVHGVGDGAPWIVEKFKDNFGGQGRYVIDFYHVSEYLAAAALKLCRKGKERGWVRRQQGRLLNNQLSKVLRSLGGHQEVAEGPETPVRDAYRYLQERRQHLDYQNSAAEKYPIGSGEIESGHRHVVQQRLKIAGAWWKETNLQLMLNLRVARANHWWAKYWSSHSN